jgi:hypothetical protein
MIWKRFFFTRSSLRTEFMDCCVKFWKLMGFTLRNFSCVSSILYVHVFGNMVRFKLFVRYNYGARCLSEECRVVFVAPWNEAFDVVRFVLTGFKNIFRNDRWKTFYRTECRERFGPPRNNSAGPFQFAVQFCRVKEASN